MSDDDVDAVFVLGDQLTDRVGPLTEYSDARVLMVESEAFGRRRPYHPHRLILLYSAMRHFRDRLREAGRTVTYITATSMAEGIETYLSEHPGDHLVAMRPQRHGATDRLTSVIEEAGGAITWQDHAGFLVDPATFDTWMGDPPYTHETFYREVRRETGYLMDDGSPVGGEWNYDEENRETPPADYEPPERPRYDPDATTQAVIEMVTEQFDGSYDTDPVGGAWADPEPFAWPVTRADALDALDQFITDRLADFGPYQDAMVEGERSMNHSLLSPLLHVGLLHPAEVTERAIEAYHDGAAPLNSVEGFIRQVIGWREFVRHVYRRTMPELVEANQLAATEPLPEAFWTGETDMACLADVIEGVRTRGYAHHIERLMILANLATSARIDPAAFNRWFEAAFVDGFHWASTPNVVGMGTYGSDVLSSKPYVSSANYIDKMSDYCSDCPYDPDATTGTGACPFNTLYWDFLDAHEDRLRSNHRMSLVYGHLDRKSDEEKTAIRDRAADLRQRLRAGTL